MDLASRPAVSLCQANIIKINATVVAKSVKCFFADGNLSSTSPASKGVEMGAGKEEEEEGTFS